MFDHGQLCRCVLECLGDFLTDAFELIKFRLLAVRQVVVHALARQVLGQCGAATPFAFVGNSYLVIRRERQGRYLHKQFCLSHELLARRAKVHAAQRRELLMQRVQNRGVLAMQIGNHAEKGIDIARKCFDVERSKSGHADSTNRHA